MTRNGKPLQLIRGTLYRFPIFWSDVEEGWKIVPTDIKNDYDRKIKFR